MPPTDPLPTQRLLTEQEKLLKLTYENYGDVPLSTIMDRSLLSPLQHAGYFQEFFGGWRHTDLARRYVETHQLVDISFIAKCYRVHDLDKKMKAASRSGDIQSYNQLSDELRSEGLPPEEIRKALRLFES